MLDFVRDPGRMLWVAAALKLAGGGHGFALGGPESRPNVLILLADDLGSHDLGCTGAAHNRGGPERVVTEFLGIWIESARL